MHGILKLISGKIDGLSDELLCIRGN